MKIAVTSTGSDLTSTVEARFGRCPYFLMFDIDTMEFEAIKNPNIAAAGGAGIQSAQMMSEKGVQTVLTGNCGPNAFRVFGAAGIQVIVGVSGIVRDVVEQFKTGIFSNAEGPNVASHFGMGTDADSTTESLNQKEVGDTMSRGIGRGMGGGRGMGSGRGMGGGRGMGSGRGMGGGKGMGSGRGMGIGQGMGQGISRYQQKTNNLTTPGFQQQTTDPTSSEKGSSVLREQATELESRLNETNSRIHEMEKNTSRAAGLIAFVDSKKCEGCMRCMTVCDLQAISLVNNISQINADLCNGCGMCVIKCKHNALSLRKG